LSKDFERKCATSEAWLLIAMVRLMVRRLAKNRLSPIDRVASWSRFQSLFR